MTLRSSGDSMSGPARRFFSARSRKPRQKNSKRACSKMVRFSTRSRPLKTISSTHSCAMS